MRDTSQPGRCAPVEVDAKRVLVVRELGLKFQRRLPELLGARACVKINQ